MEPEKQNEQERTLEERFEELEKLAGSLESGELSLEASFQAYEKGMELLKQCSAEIDLVEKKMITLQNTQEEA